MTFLTEWQKPEGGQAVFADFDQKFDGILEEKNLGAKNGINDSKRLGGARNEHFHVGNLNVLSLLINLFCQ